MDVKHALKIVNVAIILALCVVLLGAWTRINDAGLSCPDWPGCYGHMVLPSDQEILTQAQSAYPQIPLEKHKTDLEMWHRYLAGALGMLIAGIAFIAFRLRSTTGYPVKSSFGLLVLVIIQALFGMWTVTLKLYPPVVTLHLLGGVVTLTLLIFVRIRLRQLFLGLATEERISHLNLVRLAIIVLLLQIILGGWTSSNYAGPACAHWFSCNPESDIRPDFKQGFNPMAVVGPNYQGGLLPVEARSAIQIGHRFGAVTVVLMAIVLVFKLSHLPGLVKPLMFFSLLVMMQLVLGALNVIFAVPSTLAMLHHAVAIALLLSLLWVYGEIKTIEGVRYE